MEQFERLSDTELEEYNGGGIVIYLEVIGLIATLCAMAYTVSKETAYNNRYEELQNSQSIKADKPYTYNQLNDNRC